MMSRALDLGTIEIELRKLRLESAEAGICYKPFSIKMTKESPTCRVIGPSGCGKTTFFKSLISRFVEEWSISEHLEREIELSINNISFALQIGFAAQSPYFIPRESAIQNIIAPFRWKRLPQPSDEELDKILCDFHLVKLRDRAVHRFSAGERQRLNMARMFAAHPELAIIDECLSPIDEDTAKSIAETIAAKYTTLSRVLITSHRSSDIGVFSGPVACLRYVDETGSGQIVRNVTTEVNGDD